VPGMVNPQAEAGCVVGENSDGPTRNIARLDDGRECALWVGLDSFTPHIAFASGAWAVATWGAPTGVRMALLEPADFAAPKPPDPKPQPPTPDPDRWTLALDGTLVTDAFASMFGNAPRSPDGRRICLHKNVNEQEWREIHAPSGTCFHLFDRSRYPGDVGWYLYSPDENPLWAVNEFHSGDPVNFDGEIVEMKDGRRHRWTHTNTLYGLRDGGTCVQFDPRFPKQDYGPEKCYERQFSSPTHGARWELWYTPDTPAARALPWGDRSLDVLKQEVESGPPVPQPPKPYLECPRLSLDSDPWAKPPAQKPEPKPMNLPNDAQMVNFMRRLHIEGYCGELRRRGGIFDAPNPDESQIRNPERDDEYIDDLSISVWTGRYVRYFAAVTAGDAHEIATRRVLSDLGNSDEARNKRGEPKPQPGPAFRGQIGVSGDDFVVPG
jgi:hypothetical protein